LDSVWNKFLLGRLGCELDSLMEVNQGVKIQLVPSKEARLEANSKLGDGACND
ncbi:hypothetical protein MKX03_029989, partial [Papaver bracteatum]